MEGDQKGRRASPLILHVQGFKDNKACMVAIFLQAKLIPNEKTVTVSGYFNKKIPLKLSNDFTAITDFMDFLINSCGGKEIK
jgi:CRISPR/Cas system CMR-associated protein Cmr1 (group 7 of RAMP superfamily)